MISCILGFVIHVLIEAPFLALEKLIFYRKSLVNEIVIQPVDIMKDEMAEVKKTVNSEVQNNQKKNVLFICQNEI